MSSPIDLKFTKSIVIITTKWDDQEMSKWQWGQLTKTPLLKKDRVVVTKLTVGLWKRGCHGNTWETTLVLWERWSRGKRRETTLFLCERAIFGNNNKWTSNLQF